MAPTDIKEYLQLDYTIVLQRDQEGDWVASIKEFEGCLADGPTPDEAIQNLQTMKELWLKVRSRSKRPIPLPIRDEEDFSGKWVQRVPKSLHRKLVRAAEQDGVSLNQFVATALAEIVGERVVSSSKNISVVAIGEVDTWPAIPRDERGEWQIHNRVPLDRRKRDHSIRSLLKKTPAIAENSIGNELKGGNEETNEIWSSERVEVACR